MQCVIVKAGQRCTHDSASHLAGGLQLPIVKPDTKVWLCADCIYDLYQAITVRDFPQGALTPDQVRKEFGGSTR